MLREGGDPATAFGGRLEDLAKAMGKVSAANQEFQRTQQNVVAGMDELRSGTQGLITGAFSAVRQGQDVGKSVLNSLGGMADKLFDRTVAKPLAEGALGFMGKGTGGLLKEMGIDVGKIFGDPQAPVGLDSLTKGLGTTTGTMTVTAAVVNLSGGAGLSTGSLPGLGGSPGARVGMPGSGGSEPGAGTSANDVPTVSPVDVLPPERPSFDPSRIRRVSRSSGLRSTVSR